jgi:hypothetical protein
MACSSHQSRNVKALRCCQTNGLAGTGYSFKTTEITPVSTTYIYERSNFSSAPGPADVSRSQRFVRSLARPAQPKHSLRQHMHSTGMARGR